MFHNVLLYRFFSTVARYILSSFLYVHVRLLRDVLFTTVDFLAVPSPSLD